MQHHFVITRSEATKQSLCIEGIASLRSQ